MLFGISKERAKARGDELLDRVGLTAAADRRVGTYSGGMRRRLDLALSLIHGPTVLFLDEPTTGLDPMSRLALWDEVRRLNEDGTTVLLTTQYLEEADQLAGRIAIIDHGRIVKEGEPKALKDEVGAPTLIVALDHVHEVVGAEVLARFGEPRPAAVGLARRRAHRRRGGARRRACARSTTRASSVQHMELNAPSLDDVFAEATGHRLEGAGEATPASRMTRTPARRLAAGADADDRRPRCSARPAPSAVRPGAGDRVALVAHLSPADHVRHLPVAVPARLRRAVGFFVRRTPPRCPASRLSTASSTSSFRPRSRRR